MLTSLLLLMRSKHQFWEQAGHKNRMGRHRLQLQTESYPRIDVNLINRVGIKRGDRRAPYANLLLACGHKQLPLQFGSRAGPGGLGSRGRGRWVVAISAAEGAKWAPIMPLDTWRQTATSSTKWNRGLQCSRASQWLRHHNNSTLEMNLATNKMCKHRGRNQIM